MPGSLVTETTQTLAPLEKGDESAGTPAQLRPVHDTNTHRRARLGLRCPAPPRTDCGPWPRFLFYNPQGAGVGAAAYDTGIPEAHRFVPASPCLLMRLGTRWKPAECLGS